MPDRYSVVHLPHLDLISIGTGATPLTATAGHARYQIVDSFADGAYINGPYPDVREANLACARMNSGVDILYLPSFNRLHQEKIGAIIIESGREIFVGLTRRESETYASLHAGEVIDKFIDLDRKHKRALTGIDDL